MRLNTHPFIVDVISMPIYCDRSTVDTNWWDKMIKPAFMQCTIMVQVIHNKINNEAPGYIGSDKFPLSSAAQSTLTLSDPMDHEHLGFPVHHHLRELT